MKKVTAAACPLTLLVEGMINTIPSLTRIVSSYESLRVKLLAWEPQERNDAIINTE